MHEIRYTEAPFDAGLSVIGRAISVRDGLHNFAVLYFKVQLTTHATIGADGLDHPLTQPLLPFVHKGTGGTNIHASAAKLASRIF
jgi:cystathionine beta-lyase family protein involved in aluminum resistance